jgi:hypothetical protein
MSTEVLKELNFSKRPFGQDLLAEDIGDFFDGNTLAGLGVGGCTVDRY